MSTLVEHRMVCQHESLALGGAGKWLPWREFAIGKLEFNGVIVNLPRVAGRWGEGDGKT